MNLLSRFEKQLFCLGKCLPEWYSRQFSITRTNRNKDNDDEEVYTDYFNRYQQIYDSPPLFQSYGNVHSRKMAGDYVKIREQFLESVAKKSHLLKEAERNEALKYYDFYYQLFKPSEEHLDKIMKEESSTYYYDTFCNMNQVAEQLYGDKSAMLNYTNTLCGANTEEVKEVNSTHETHKGASAQATIELGELAFNLIKQNSLEKGDLMTTAKIAGIMAAKKTSSLIPLCQNKPNYKVDVSVNLDDATKAVVVDCHIQTLHGNNDVEIEALTGVTVAALTVYDMCKNGSRCISINNIKLLHKS